MSDNCRIMIVDDEFIMRQGIRFMMDWEKEGYEVAGEASNGKEALDLLEEISPHIILCDIAMPVMDGLDFIKIVKREYPDIQIVVLSGYDKFEYVRQALLNGAVDYVLKPTLNPEELLKVVSRAVQKVPGLRLKRKQSSGLETQLERFFTGYDSQLNTWEFQKVFQGSCYRLLILPLRRQDRRGRELSPVLYEKMEALLKEQTYASFLKFLLSQELLCVVLNYGLKDEKRLLDFLEELMAQMSLLYDRVFATAGERRRKLEELKIDYQNFISEEEEIFYHEDLHLFFQETGAKKPAMEKFDFRKFVAFLGEHRYEESIELFYTYICNAVQSHISEFKLKNQTKNLLYNILSSSEDQAGELEKIRKEYFDQIDQAPFCQDFLGILEELCQKLKEILVTQKGQDVYLKEILEYIQKHYKEELDLQSLAEIFNFNYSYLSAYFNAHMGEGFSEYLNRVRIEKACEYLKQREYSIAQISALTGYSDHSYFCRVFKKVTGKTPSEYRRERRQEL